VALGDIAYSYELSELVIAKIPLDVLVVWNSFKMGIRIEWDGIRWGFKRMPIRGSGKSKDVLKRGRPNMGFFPENSC
jgi:hypothetical protein